MHNRHRNRSFKYLLNLCREINGYQLRDLTVRGKRRSKFFMEALNHTSSSFALLMSSSFHYNSVWRRQPKQYSSQKSKTLQRPHCSNRSASHALTYLLNIWKKFQLQSTHKRHVAWLYLDGIVYEDDDLHTHNDLSSYFAYITERTWNMWPASQAGLYLCSCCVMCNHII